MATHDIIHPNFKSNEEYWNCISFRCAVNLWVLIDVDDYDWVIAITWERHYSRKPKFYIRSTKTHRRIRLHRIIIKTPPDMYTDHINHDSLDNRKCNLRICTSAQNCMNSSKRNGKSSKYKGVYRTPSGNWSAQINIKGQAIHIGTYPTENAAAMAYNDKIILYYGSFANPNIIS